MCEHLNVSYHLVSQTRQDATTHHTGHPKSYWVSFCISQVDSDSSATPLTTGTSTEMRPFTGVYVPNGFQPLAPGYNALTIIASAAPMLTISLSGPPLTSASTTTYTPPDPSVTSKVFTPKLSGRDMLAGSSRSAHRTPRSAPNSGAKSLYTVSNVPFPG